MKPRTATRVAWSVWTFAMLLLAGAITLIILNRGAKQDLFITATGFAMAIGYATVGVFISSRQPRNPIGWLFGTIGFSLSVGSFAIGYVSRGLVVAPGSLPGVPYLGLVSEIAFLFSLIPIPLALLLFPTGSPPSPRWTLVVWMVVTAAALALIGFIIKPGLVGAPGAQVPNPTGVPSLSTLGGVLLAVAGVGSVGAAFASAVALVLRFRRARGEERQQIKWLAYVAIAAAILLPGGFVSGIWESPVNAGLFVAFVVTMAVGIPVASAIAILKYRLYDIDVVIRKTVLYALLAAVLTAIYLVVALAIPAIVVGRGSSRGFTLAAVIVMAVAFNLVRTRARRLANRLVYGKRATPYEVLSEFADRVAGTYGAEDVLPRMARVLAEGTGARRAGVWLRFGHRLRPAASWPPGGETQDDLVMSGQDLPSLPRGDRAFPVGHQGELLGALTVSMPPSEPLTPAQAKLVQDIAAQAGLVLRNVRLIEDLRASRQRLVAAQDEERRRLERNLHDGAQQQLVALSIKLRLARDIIPKDPDKAVTLVEQLSAETLDALENLRDLARGIYPPLLADQGLAAALQAQARKSPVPVSVQTDGADRYPQEIEAAVYFCCLEALQNVAKYARATTATVRIFEQEGGWLTFEVHDDGAGFDTSTLSYGTGLQGMADRLAAEGGTLGVRSAPGEGTTVLGKLPLGALERVE
jgi:signal transduction histidine kinase